MTNEQLATAYQQTTDPTKRKALLETLWLRNASLWKKAAWKYRSTGEAAGHTLQDLQQIAFEAMAEAVQRWKPDGWYFSTLWMFEVKRLYRNHLQHNRQSPDVLCAHGSNAPLSFDAAIATAEDGCTLHEIVGDPQSETAFVGVVNQIDAKPALIALRGALLKLPLHQQAVAYLRLVKHLSPQQTALRLGLTVADVSKLYFTAKRKLQTNYRLRFQLELAKAESCPSFGTGLNTFRETGASSVERSVHWRLRQELIFWQYAEKGA